MTANGPVEETGGRPGAPAPRVSIGMPVYNGAAFLETALASILGQSFTDFELIVSDNGSTDDTAEICRRAVARDPRVRYFRHPENVGAAPNYNFALARARAPYFKWATHDDVLERRFLERCVAALDAAPADVVLVYPRTLLIDATGRVTGAYQDRLDLRMARPSDRLRHLLRNLRLSNAIFGLLRRDVLLRTGRHGNYNGADYVLLAELAMEGRFQEILEPLFLRRMHADISTARHKSVRQIAAWFDVANRRKRFLFPRLRLFVEHLRAIGRAPLGVAEKLRCFRVYLIGIAMRTRLERRGRRRREQLEREAAATATTKTEDAVSQGLEHHRAGRLAEATTIYATELQRVPDRPDAMHLMGLAFAQRGLDKEAAALLERAVALQRGRRLDARGLMAVMARIGLVAAQSDGDAGPRPRLQPEAGPALEAWGRALLRHGRHAEALLCFEAALTVDDGNAERHVLRGTALYRLGRLDEAVAGLRAAVARQPDHLQALRTLALALNRKGDRAAAAESCRRILALEPDDAEATGNLMLASRAVCDWSDHDRLMERLAEALERTRARGGSPPINPSFAQNLPLDAVQLRRLAEDHARDVLKAVPELREGLDLGLPPAGPRARLRVGYLSEGFRDYPTAHLIQGLFREHDRGAVEVCAYSYGPDDGSVYRRNIARRADRFVDLRTLDDAEAAQRIHDDGVDILVDLKGYTTRARPRIAALRPAPVQVSFLGFPGTWGCAAVDYILVDRIVVPPELAEGFSEQLAWLPNCYQVTDDRQVIAEPAPGRADCGLPEDAVVFCSFNKPFKIDALCFRVWMQLLRDVPGSVLWLIHDNDAAEANLRRSAGRLGVAPERLVFAPLLPKDRHLARHRLADLFLDTFYCNAHTTATDALWAGLPVVTRIGRTLQARVAASLLVNAGLPALVTTDARQYLELARRLALEPERLAALKRKLAGQRETCPLFDTARFARGLEAMYRKMWALHERGEAPRQLEVANAELGFPWPDRGAAPVSAAR